MKKEIRQFLKANPNLKNVVCKGYTSSPSTPQDRTLARKRGKATCDYILTLRPDAQVTIRSGSHTNKPGSQIRRVEIKLS
jgi:outer membrane protein OmpA-like peptidoglycan-associated protein